VGKAFSGPEAVKDTVPHPYHGSAPARASVTLAAATPVLFAALAALLGGCSTQISSLLPGGVSDQGPTVIRHQAADDSVTGSIPLQMTHAPNVPQGMSATDWPLAQAALREALSRTDDGPSVPWNNPASGARGTVTPIASAFDKDGLSCRNFLASHVLDGVERWSEGTACRKGGVWDVSAIKPLKKS
jgi:surface antigen